MSFGVLAIGSFLLRNVPQVMDPLYGGFGNLLSVRLYIAIVGCMSYILATIEDIIELNTDWSYFIIILCIITGTVALSHSWTRRYDPSFRDEHKALFWTTAMGREKFKKEWAETNHLPKSTIKTLSLFVYEIGPIITLGLFPLFISLLIYMLESFSVLFAIILTGWFIFTLIRWLNKKNQSISPIHVPDYSDRLYRGFINAQLFQSMKGFSGMFCFSFGLLIACLWNLISFAYIGKDPFGIVNIYTRILPEWTSLIIFGPSAAYQLYFWYIILNRFPYFIQSWKQEKEIPMAIPSLPRGGFVAYIIASFTPITIWVYAELLMPLPFTLLWIALGGIYSFLLASSIGRRSRDTSSPNICLDNLHIPIAALASTYGFVIFTALSWFHTDARVLFNEVNSLLSFSLFVFFWFYIEDIEKYWESKFRRSWVKYLIGIFNPVLATSPFLFAALSTSGVYQISSYVMVGMGVLISFCLIILRLMFYTTSRKNIDRKGTV